MSKTKWTKLGVYVLFIFLLMKHLMLVFILYIDFRVSIASIIDSSQQSVSESSPQNIGYSSQ
jgi:hypothetical protein